MKPASLAKMRAICGHLEELCPSFTWRAYSVAEVEHGEWLDPPCPLIRGTFGPFEVSLDADGGLDAICNSGARGSYYHPHINPVDMTAAPVVVAASVMGRIREAGE